jgi:hypothetical protein
VSTRKIPACKGTVWPELPLACCPHSTGCGPGSLVGPGGQQAPQGCGGSRPKHDGDFHQGLGRRGQRARSSPALPWQLAEAQEALLQL